MYFVDGSENKAIMAMVDTENKGQARGGSNEKRSTVSET